MSECCEKSCGAVVFTRVDGDIKYVIIQSLAGYYGFPKGHMEAGESEVQTALRELYEETGLTANLDAGRRATISYPVGTFGRKEVVFYLGEVTGIPRVREGEIERYKWVTAEQLPDYLFPDTVEACRTLLR